ncbi:MAG: MBL fold metallo-hydrolase [bacterium]
MKITLWGTRGSLPSPGPETVRYGGNTSCVEVRSADGTLLVLDAGTGIRRLGNVIEPDIKRIDILLTHLHMDHIQGFGFFSPLYRPGLDVHVYGPPSTTHDLRTRLTKYLSPPLFPVRLRDLPAKLTLHDVPLGAFNVNGLRVETALISHPGPTVGYRISDRAGVLVYLPDHEPALGAPRFPLAHDWTSGAGLAERADLLIHDAQYTLGEYERHVGWGHSAIEHTVGFAALAEVKHLLTFHHDPGHSDEMIDRMEQAVQRERLPFALIPGREDASFVIGPESVRAA